jgi:large subunit ribosomal protein L18
MRIPSKNKTKEDARERRRVRARKKINGTAERPRLAVFRSARHIYAQVIDDDKQVTLASVSTMQKALRDEVKSLKKREKAKRVGAFLAQVCKDKGIVKVVFDKAGYRYHGRIKALADGAREGGLSF